MDLFKPFLDGSYAPHGYCLLWQPELIWTHVIADSLIALAYFSIPLALISFVRRRRDIVFGSIFWLFAVFIMACGATHVMAIWTLWHANYGLEAVVKVITAGASVATATVLWPLLPKALALPSPAKLSAVNANLAAMVQERDQAIAELREQSLQRQKAEAALIQSQKLEAVGQLTGGIAHDFNNLLQAIASSVELTLRNPDDPVRIARWSRNALKAVESGQSLTGRLLAFSRFQQLALIPMRLRLMADEMSEIIQRSIGPAIRLETDIAADDCVIADKVQLELALLNLAINARDAMPDGGTLKISTRACSGKVHPQIPEGDYVELLVADTGVGMDPDVLAHALEPFFTTKGVGKGTGLGLSMVFGVVTQSGGAMTIDSREGEGTVVRLFLRRAPSGAVAAEAVDGPARGDRSPLAGRRVLLIDDDERVREVIADALSDAGAQVVPAANGEAGLKLFAADKPHLIIVDFAMPGINGGEVARRVRHADPNLPILIISGFAQSASLTELIGPDMNVLKKPFRNSDLIEVAEHLLEGGPG